VVEVVVVVEVAVLVFVPPPQPSIAPAPATARMPMACRRVMSLLPFSGVNRFSGLMALRGAGHAPLDDGSIARRFVGLVRIDDEFRRQTTSPACIQRGNPGSSA